MFISFEGIDKSGKSTQVRLLADFLFYEKNQRVVVTREPGGTLFGEKIKKLVLKDEEVKANPFAELFLYLADRAQHVEKVIIPGLKEGKIVISDRYADASFAYQGYGRGLDVSLICELNQKVTKGIWPDITFLLNLDPEIAMKREKSSDKIEKEKLSFHKRVMEGYLELARAYPQRIKVIKADTSPSFIHNQIKKIILEKFSHEF